MEVGEIETQMDVDGLDVAVCIRLPATATASNPVPGVVFVDGSGPSHRHDFGPQPPWFLDAGFAVLTYDKPGCGDTAGDWRSQTIPDRARHAAAALEKLRRQNGVDPRRVGLWGASQGGWVVPLAAGQDPSVAFAMLVSSAGVSPFEQEAVSLQQRMRMAGEPQEAIERATAAYWSLVERLRRGDPPAGIAADLAVDDPRYRYFHEELLTDPELLSFFALIGDHDPLPAVESMRCPTLLIWGENDPLVPVAQSERVFREGLAAAGNRDVTVVVFPAADHWIMVEGPGGEREWAPGYIDTMTAWALARSG
nr:alpha/beta fold hydrolase [Acidimicrobiia bacterium]